MVNKSQRLYNILIIIRYVQLPHISNLKPLPRQSVELRLRITQKEEPSDVNMNYCALFLPSLYIDLSSLLHDV